ncbi:hypothetical protein ACFVXH_39990 [Kitasatospora sp. NPDC058184]|uniref:hypothetical protein n=1 Tax=Kitasatospora sp. NPDC058184 TaxID=3346370 RepID=UPI0036DA3784
MTTETTPSTQGAEQYYAGHIQDLHDYAARLVTNGPHPDHALAFTLVDGGHFLPFPSQVRTGTARAAVRSARKHTVYEYDTTDRSGAKERIVYIRYAAGTWSNVRDVVDIYVIPQEAPGHRTAN